MSVFLREQRIRALLIFLRREYVAKFVTFDDDEGPSVTHLWGFFWDLVKKNKEIHDVSEFSTVAD